MPVASDMPTLLEAIRESRTKTTKALDHLFDKPQRWKTDPNPIVKNAITWLWSSTAFDAPLPPDVRKILKGDDLGQPASPNLPLPPTLRLNDTELLHIDEWPSAQKDRVRKNLKNAIDLNCDVHFFWKLTPGSQEQTDPIETPVAGGDITVTFRSPEQNVQGGAVTVVVAP